MTPERAHAAAAGVLRSMGDAAVAVSGGVDSTTLAALAHRCLGPRAAMYHAISPAVPPEATERVRALARGEGWRLTVLDAGEFSDERYRANPVDRCYHCKSHLYDAIAAHAAEPVVSGTNVDDLADVRPGLRAAAARDVRHPYVEAGLDKAAVRVLARRLGLRGLSALPASPCLSSRVETGLRIERGALVAIHAAERLVAGFLAPDTVRCRLRRDRIAVELDPATLSGLDQGRAAALRARVASVFRSHGLARPVRLEPYRMGGAFLRGSAR